MPRKKRPEISEFIKWDASLRNGFSPVLCAVFAGSRGEVLLMSPRGVRTARDTGELSFLDIDANRYTFTTSASRAECMLRDALISMPSGV